MLALFRSFVRWLKREDVRAPNIEERIAKWKRSATLKEYDKFDRAIIGSIDEQGKRHVYDTSPYREHVVLSCDHVLTLHGARLRRCFCDQCLAEALILRECQRAAREKSA